MDIADSIKRKLFGQLLKDLDFVEVVNSFKSGKKANLVLEVMEEMKAHVAGRKKLKSAEQWDRRPLTPPAPSPLGSVG